MPFRSHIPSIFAATLLLTAAIEARAFHSLGQIARIDNEAYFSLEFRSDLWSTPGRDKPSPLRNYDLGLNIPIVDNLRWKSALAADVDGLSTGRSDLTVGRHQVLVGSDLRAQQYGIGLTREFEDLSSVSIFESDESDSDEPFQNGRDTWWESTAVYRFAPTDTRQWVVGMNYSKNRGFMNNIAIPYFGVIYKPYPGFSAIIGFPHIRLTWEKKGTGAVELKLNPTRVEADLRRVVSDYTVGFLRSGLSARSYLHIHRVEDDYRLFFQEEYVALGAETRLSVKTSFRVFVGWSFERSLYEGKQIFQNIGPHTKLPSDAMGGIAWEYRI